jgi:putative SOS response-associated peptidase YedK
MCGRFSIAVRIGYLAERFGVCEPVGISLPRFNIAPAEEVPVITGNGCVNCVMLHWGLVAPRTNDRKPAPALVNIRAEGLNGNNPFRILLPRGRCIVPATGFYEWGKSGSRKYPMYFRLKHMEVFGMAGLCDIHQVPDGRTVGTFSVITTSPNSLVGSLHDRMPAILNQENEKKWLDQEHGTVEELVQMLNPFPSGEMKTYRVTRRVNRPSYKSGDAVEEEIPGTCELSRWDVG